MPCHSCHCLSSLSTLSLGKYIHSVRAQGTKYSILVTAIASLFMIQGDHSSFLKKNQKTQNKDKHFSFWLATHPSARLIIIHRTDKLSCIETHYYPILDANNLYFEQNISAAVSDRSLFNSLKVSVYSTDLFPPSFLSSPLCSAVLCIICGIKWDIFP